MTSGARGEPRVLHIGLGGAEADGGGSARYLRELVDSLVALGVPANAVLVHEVDRPLVVRLRAVGRACAEATPVPDVVDVHFPLYGLLPSRTGALRRVPTVAHFHGPWADEVVAAGRTGRTGAWLRRVIERAVLRHAEVVVVLSGAFGAEVVQRYGVSPWRVRIVPPGVDATALQPGRPRHPARARFDLGPSDFVAASVRRLVPRSGVDVLVDTWAELGADDATLLVGGDGTEASALRARADAHGSPGVRFLGRVDAGALADVYRAADVSVVPSRAWEGFGLVVLESLACGTPALVSDEGGLPEAVLGLDPGLVVPAGDPVALAGRLASARQEPDTLPARAACRVYATTFAWSDVARRHRDVYRAVMRPTDARPLPRGVDRPLPRALGRGGWRSQARVLGAMTDVDVHVILFERGPLGARLGSIGVTHEVVPLPARAGGFGRDHVRPSLDAVVAAGQAVVHTVRVARRVRRLRPDVVHTNSVKAAVVGGLAAKVAAHPVGVAPARARGRHADAAPRRVRAAPTRAHGPRRRRRELGCHPPQPRRCCRRRLVDLRGSGLHRCAHGVAAGTRTRAAPRLADRRRRWSPRAAEGPTRVPLGLRRRVRRRPVRARARVVGAALFGEDVYAASLRDLAAGLGVADRVEFVGFVPDVAVELDALDVLVVPSLVPEGFGLAVVEGMAVGLPVIAPAAGGPAEIVTDGVDGMLVPAGDPAALATALRALAADPSTRRRLGDAARARAVGFTPEHSAARLVEALRAATRTQVAS